MCLVLIIRREFLRLWWNVYWIEILTVGCPTLTLDNYTTNDVVVSTMRISCLVVVWCLEGLFFHMLCDVHVLNLIVKDGLSTIDKGIERNSDNVSYWKTTPKGLKILRKQQVKFIFSPSRHWVLIVWPGETFYRQCWILL